MSALSRIDGLYNLLGGSTCGFSRVDCNPEYGCNTTGYTEEVGDKQALKKLAERLILKLILRLFVGLG